MRPMMVAARYARWLLSAGTILFIVMAWAGAGDAQADSVPFYSYRIIRSYPHDPNAFTQGLIYRDGALIESTGLNGRSSLRRVRLETGDVVKQHDVPRRYFAEGLTEWRGDLIQLTWDSNIAFVYDSESFAQRRTFGYRGEGWGLTHDGTRLIMSDGTANLRFLDPTTFKEVSRVRVTAQGTPVEHLNELEYIRGQILANVWLTDRIAIIDPASGHVTAWLDLAGLMPSSPALTNAVLNGIAYDDAGDRLFVTGKLWPTLFEIRIDR